MKALRREQALGRRYRELVDGLRNAIVWVAEPDSLVMSFVSASTDDLLGWTPDRDDAGALLELVHPADRAAFEGQLRVLGLDKPVTFEHRLNARDGETWARTSVRLERKLDTEGHEVRGFTVDISDAKDLERTLRLTAHASEELGKSLDVNDIAERLALACVPELADGCMVTIEQAARRDDDGPPAIARASAWASGRMREHSERVDPVTLPIDVAGRAVGTASLWRVGSEPDEGALLVARDLTRRAAQAIENAELYQKTLDAIAHRDEFLSVASHELRTPLLPLKLNIQSCVAALKAGDVSLPSFAKKLELADRQVDRLENLVSSLLDVARIRTGKLELDRDKTDLAALVTEVVARFRPELARKGVELTCDAQPVWGTWDKSRLDQVVSNLVSNAIKYGNGKPIDIHVRSAPSKAVLIVADHGIGLAADDRERIFARFERAVSANNYGGLGLGLYIARQIVRAHGGNIHVESAPGQGCQFIVELPVEHLLATPAGASATAS